MARIYIPSRGTPAATFRRGSGKGVGTGRRSVRTPPGVVGAERGTAFRDQSFRNKSLGSQGEQVEKDGKTGRDSNAGIRPDLEGYGNHKPSRSRRWYF